MVDDVIYGQEEPILIFGDPGAAESSLVRKIIERFSAADREAIFQKWSVQDVSSALLAIPDHYKPKTYVEHSWAGNFMIVIGINAGALLARYFANRHGLKLILIDPILCHDDTELSKLIVDIDRDEMPMLLLLTHQSDGNAGIYDSFKRERKVFYTENTESLMKYINDFANHFVWVCPSIYE